MSLSICLIYATFPTQKEAEEIIKVLLKQKIIACANILPKGISYYHWEGEIKNSGEFVIMMKTKTAHFSAIEKIIKANHSYECPCIICLPVTNINDGYLNWLEEIC